MVNDKDQGIAYKDIKKGNDIIYRLNVSLRLPDDHVEIINFENIKLKIHNKDVISWIILLIEHEKCVPYLWV